MYNLLKNGSTLVEWAGDSRFTFEPLPGNEGWVERLHLPGYTSIKSEWVSVVAGSGGRSQDKSIRVNGAKFLVAEIDGQAGGRQLYDADRQLLMGLQCDTQGHLKELRLPPGFYGIRYNYDGFVLYFYVRRRQLFKYSKC